MPRRPHEERQLALVVGVEWKCTASVGADAGATRLAFLPAFLAFVGASAFLAEPPPLLLGVARAGGLARLGGAVAAALRVGMWLVSRASRGAF